MVCAQVSKTESARLAALRRYEVLDTPSEAEFDDFTRLASQVCGTPIAVISLIDAERQWFKSKIGLTASETPRDISFCGHGIQQSQVFEVSNALTDERFRENPLVIGEPHIRFYAGTPLVTPDGHAIGMLCVHDRVPRSLTHEQREGLAALGRLVVRQLELRLATRRERQLNEELSRKAAFKQALLDSAACAIATVDVDGVLTSFNPCAERLLGYSATELVGKATPVLFHDPGEVAERALELTSELGRRVEPGFDVFVAHTLQHGENDTHEWTMIRKDGARVPVQLSVSALRDEAGTLLGFISIARDLTERKRTEDALRSVNEHLEQRVLQRTAALEAVNRELQAEIADRKQAETSLRQADEKYRNIFENAVEGIFRTTPDGNYIIANPALARMYGFDSADELMTSIAKIQSQLYVDSNRRDEFKRALEKNNSLFGFESRIYRKDGSIIWISENARAVRDENGALLFYEGTTEDITERKQAEELLRESVDCFSGAFEHAPIGMSLVALDGHWLKVNRALCDMVGYSETELLSRTFQDITHPDDLAADLENVERLLARACNSYQMEKRYIHRLGHFVDVLLIVSLVRDIEDQPRYFVAQIQDITERKRAEEAKLKLEEQVRQTQKMDAIGQLAGGVAHDFNNQLNVIMGYADLLKNPMNQVKLLYYVDNIYKAARRSADLTKNLLAFARKGKFQTAPVNMHKILIETIEMLDRTIDKRIVIGQTFKARFDVVTGDPSQLQNALLNLAVNARDAMADGGKLTFETENVDVGSDFIGLHGGEIPPGSYIKVSVSDSGCGMSEDVQKHLFEPFFTTKPVGKGTGLGLASVYGTVKSHKGLIDVYSQSGHGTTFKIYLPVEVPKSMAGEKLKPCNDSALWKKVNNLRVLLVEDEEALRSMFGDMLDSCGIHCITAANGRRAIDVYQPQWHEIDLVILDMIMPEMNGTDAFIAMKQINPNVKVLLATGFSVNSEVQSLLDKGVSGFIQKPFTKRELIEKVNITMREKNGTVSVKYA